MDEKTQSELRRMIETLPGRPGNSARWLISEHWDSLCWIAEQYADPGPCLDEWKEAEAQWRAVELAARDLVNALDALAEPACIFEMDKIIPDAADSLWRNPKSHLQDTAEYAHNAAIEFAVLKDMGGPGSVAMHEIWTQRMLFKRLFVMLEVPTRPMAHAQRIAAVIHAWAYPKEQEVLGNPRFGERAIREAARLLRTTQTPS